MCEMIAHQLGWLVGWSVARSEKGWGVGRLPGVVGVRVMGR